MARKPELGDYIQHHEPHFNRTREGTVVQLLSAQFVYLTETKNRWMCMYNEQWKKLESKKRR